MFDAVAVCIEDFELIFVVTAEVIVERFAADGASNNLVSVTTFEKNHHATWIIVRAGVWKNEDTLIKHTEHPENTRDCRQLNVSLTAFETRDCRRADARQFTKPLLS